MLTDHVDPNDCIFYELLFLALFLQYGDRPIFFSFNVNTIQVILLYYYCIWYKLQAGINVNCTSSTNAYLLTLHKILWKTTKIGRSPYCKKRAKNKSS